MTADSYLNSILSRETVDSGPFSPVRAVQLQLQPAIATWAGGQLLSIQPSGSFAKGTANKSGTDIDLFISLGMSTTATLREIYESLFKAMTQHGYTPKRQNVSINITLGGYRVDLVPGKLQGILTDDHSLYRRKAGTWTKTNITTHINYVRQSGRSSEIRILKLWRDQKGLDFPSFYLELATIKALLLRFGTLSENVWTVLQHFRDNFSNSRVVDPANTNNVISDDLTVAEQRKISVAAAQALGAKSWNEIVR